MIVGEQIRRSVAINSSSTTVDDFFERIKKATVGWDAIRIQSDAMQDDYGDYGYVTIVVTGFSPATQEDVDKHTEELTVSMTHQEMCDRNLLRNILERNPDAVAVLKEHDKKTAKFLEIRKQER